jgi:hypothetical protein
MRPIVPGADELHCVGRLAVFPSETDQAASS